MRFVVDEVALGEAVLTVLRVSSVINIPPVPHTAITFDRHCIILQIDTVFNPLNADLNTICHLLALLGAHHILHVSRIRINIFLNTLRTGSFKLFKRPFPGFLTILTL